MIKRRNQKRRFVPYSYEKLKMDVSTSREKVIRN